ncbi:hypothetical protein ACEQ8H_005293 [Pleosporales sp. CAS-2024a]
MDIFVTNVPPRANHVELRLVVQDKLYACNVLAFDVIKKVGINWAIITVGEFLNGRRFLDRHGGRGVERILFKGVALGFKMSNRKGQPEPLKILSLLEKEARIKAQRSKQPHKAQRSGQARSTFPIKSLSTGVWFYDDENRLRFDQKFQDSRTGFVTFGKYALIIFLQGGTMTDNQWHCRIDIPYAILEHSISSLDYGKMGSITLTLKSPPKIYNVTDTEDLHLYSGQSSQPDIEQSLANLTLVAQNQDRKLTKLERLCKLHDRLEKNTGLCMVYRLQFGDMHTVSGAWHFMKSFSVPDQYCWRPMAPRKLARSIEDDFRDLEIRLSQSDLPFSVQFQVLVPVLEGTLTPKSMYKLIPLIAKRAKSRGAEVMASAVRFLGRQIPTPAPQVPASKFSISTLCNLLDDGIEFGQSIGRASLVNKQVQQEHVVMIYKAIITPTDPDTSNRVLRKYSKHIDYFMRVSFADEDGLSVFHDPKASQEEVYTRFRNILRNGISLASRHYEFLGFSHASLRCHQVWFMAPFVQNGVLVRAKDVIWDLGDFTNIRCSAKCAARIGQAFSDTIFAFRIPSTAKILEDKDDIERNGRTFSDGCGTMSLELFQMLWRTLHPRQRHKRPTVLQIRCRGAKGVLSLDTTLAGQQLHIRKSMTKYIARAGWRDLELCGAAYRPLRFYLNHQFIKILEDLQVPLQNFIGVQNEARSTLEKIVKHPLNAANFLRYSHSSEHAKIPRLFELMHYTGLTYQMDRFLCEIVEVAAMSSLRDLKYRARIPLERGCLLYGLMDETNTLQPDQVYITKDEEIDSGRYNRYTIVGDRVVVTRAPALHPGDVQVVAAVDVPEDSPLRALHNCIVFSQQGDRDLPSQLSGGDLDGDLFHIIYDSRLIPRTTAYPADYTPIKPKELGRPVEANDIVDFFIDFMKNDKLGQISNMHKIRADKNELGTFGNECIKLAKLASDAVDFSKSGVPANMADIPRGNDKIRPDFMAPGHNFITNDMGATELEDLEMEDIDDPDSISVLDPDKSHMRYYRSEKALGYLYRNIDERQFFERMKGEFAAMQQSHGGGGGESLVQKLERYIDRETRGVQWGHHTDFAEELRDYYESNMVEIMDTLRVHRGKPLTELEVFSGNILGKKERASTRYIREANREVQERFDRDVGAMVRLILEGDDPYADVDASEVLPRAIACFKVALRTEGWENRVVIRSWKYVAASVCLEELWKFQGGNLRPL